MRHEAVKDIIHRLETNLTRKEKTYDLTFARNLNGIETHFMTECYT